MYYRNYVKYRRDQLQDEDAKRSWKTGPEQRQAYIDALINEGMKVNEYGNTFDPNLKLPSKLDPSQVIVYFTIASEPGMIYWYYEGDEGNERRKERLGVFRQNGKSEKEGSSPKLGSEAQTNVSEDIVAIGILGTFTALVDWLAEHKLNVPWKENATQGMFPFYPIVLPDDNVYRIFPLEGNDTQVN